MHHPLISILLIFAQEKDLFFRKEDTSGELFAALYSFRIPGTSACSSISTCFLVAQGVPAPFESVSSDNLPSGKEFLYIFPPDTEGGTDSAKPCWPRDCEGGILFLVDGTRLTLLVRRKAAGQRGPVGAQKSAAQGRNRTCVACKCTKKRLPSLDTLFHWLPQWKTFVCPTRLPLCIIFCGHRLVYSLIGIRRLACSVTLAEKNVCAPFLFGWTSGNVLVCVPVLCSYVLASNIAVCQPWDFRYMQCWCSGTCLGRMSRCPQLFLLAV